MPYNDLLRKYHINGSKKNLYRVENSGSREEDDRGTSRDQYGEEDNGGTLVVREGNIRDRPKWWLGMT